MSVDIERDGVLFASGGLDRLVKVWLYDEGECVAVGAGHSGAIARVRISQDKRLVASVGDEGAIFLWAMPGGEAPSPPRAGGAGVAGAAGVAPARMAAVGRSELGSTVSGGASKAKAAPAAGGPAAAGAGAGAGGAASAPRSRGGVTAATASVGKGSTASARLAAAGATRTAVGLAGTGTRR